MHAISTLKPNVAVIDIRMPPTHTDEGVRAARRIREAHPGVGVVVLSQHAEPEYAMELLSEGTDGVGYLLKDRIADIDDFADSVRRVAEGGSALDPSIVGLLVARKRRSSPLEVLSAREREVLSLMAEGRSNQAIADALVVTPRAVEKHITNIFEKLGLGSAPRITAACSPCSRSCARADTTSPRAVIRTRGRQPSARNALAPEATLCLSLDSSSQGDRQCLPARASRGRSGSWSARHPWTAITLWIAFVAASIVIGSAVGTKQLTEAESASGESGVAARTLDKAGFKIQPGEQVLVQSKTLRATDPAFRAVVGDVIQPPREHSRGRQAALAVRAEHDLEGRPLGSRLVRDPGHVRHRQQQGRSHPGGHRCRAGGAPRLHDRRSRRRQLLEGL